MVFFAGNDALGYLRPRDHLVRIHLPELEAKLKKAFHANVYVFLSDQPTGNCIRKGCIRTAAVRVGASQDCDSRG